MVMMIIFTANAQWSALMSGLDIEHVTPKSGEAVRLRVGLFAEDFVASPVAVNTAHESLCYDTGSADFPQANGTFDAFILSK